MRLHLPARAAAPTRPTRPVPCEAREVLALRTPTALALWLAATAPDSVDAQVAALERADLCALVDLLTPATARTLMEALSAHTAAHLVTVVPAATGAGLLDVLPDDEASRVARLLEERGDTRVLEALPRSRSALLRGLLAWPDESAAAWMRPSFLHVAPGATLGDAVAAARRRPEDLDEGVFVLAGTHATAPGGTPFTPHGTDEGSTPTGAPQGPRTTGGAGAVVADVSHPGELLGWVAPSDLVLGDPDTVVDEVMVEASTVLGWSVVALADQEGVVSHAGGSPAGMVPVVDGDRLIGVITREAVADIAHEESGEDSALQGGTSPLGMPYLQAGPHRLWRTRVPWLAALFLAEMYTGTVLRHFEGELEQVVALSFFIPLLIGTGGNVGTQITTTLIRAMGTEGLRLRDLWRVVWKEFGTGILLGVSMAVLGGVRAWTLGVGGPVILTVMVALACICVWSSLIAAVLPMLLRRIGVDPAVVSSPMISTVVDGTGLMIYFMLAKAIVL